MLDNLFYTNVVTTPTMAENYQKLVHFFPFLNITAVEGFFKDFCKGDILIKDGEACNYFSFVLSGSIRVYKLSEEGREITLYRLTQGTTCVLSASCILGVTGYSAIAQTEVRSLVYLLPKNVFNKLFNENQLFQKFIFKTFSNRLSEVILLLEEVAFKSMDKRLADFLLSKKEKEISITHEEIAMELGTARVVVSRLLKDFEHRGFLQLHRGQINIISLKKLNPV